MHGPLKSLSAREQRIDKTNSPAHLLKNLLYQDVYENSKVNPPPSAAFAPVSDFFPEIKDSSMCVG